MRAWQTRAKVVGHVQMLDCDDKCWSDTTDGKWHPEWEEPEEGAKNNIADISYLNDDRAYSMPDLGDRPEGVRISDGWTHTMPDGDCWMTL